MSKVSTRNADLEILRFVFALGILGIHLGNVSNFPYFHNGHIGVEFFLVLSGILMAQSYNKSKDKEWFINNSVATNTMQFLLKKIRVFLPLLVVIIGAKILLFFIQSDYDVVRTINLILDFLPTLFMTPMSGAGFSNDLGIVWYLSAMIIAMMILYPIYIKYNDVSRKILFPLIGIFSLGILQMEYGYITLSWEHVGVFYGGLIRAIGEIALGAVCFDIAMKIRNTKLTKTGKFTILFIELLSLVIIGFFIYYSIQPQSLTIFFIIAIMTTLVYSEATYHIKSNKYADFLGKLSLPLFLSHLVTIGYLIYFAGSDYVYNNGWAVFLICILVSVPLTFLSDYLVKHNGWLIGKMIESK